MKRGIVLLLLCCAASKASFGHMLSFTAVNVGKVHLQCGYIFQNMASGVPDVPPPGESFNAGQTKSFSAGFASGRMAIRFAVYIDGLQMDTRSAWAQNASFSAPPIYYAFSGDSTNGTLQTWNNEPRPSAPPSNAVPVGWPNGQATPGNGLEEMQIPGAYVWNGEFFEWDNPFTDSSQQPPADLLSPGQEWKFGLRPGGPVMAPNADVPEWYADYANGLQPTEWVDENGLSVVDVPPDFDGDGVADLAETSANRMDYWGRTLADLGASRNGLISDLNGNVLAMKQGIEQSAIVYFPDEIDLGAWANLDKDIYKTGVDTNFMAASISPSIADSDYNILTGESRGNSFISGLGNGVAGAVETLLQGVTAFLDPFKGIGKVASLTVVIYNKAMVIDFSPYMAVINVIRAIAVLCVYYLSFCSVRSAVFMIFGGA